MISYYMYWKFICPLLLKKKEKKKTFEQNFNIYQKFRMSKAFRTILNRRNNNNQRQNTNEWMKENFKY